MSRFTPPETIEDYNNGASGSSSGGGGIVMTPNGPMLCMQPAVVKTE